MLRPPGRVEQFYAVRLRRHTCRPARLVAKPLTVDRDWPPLAPACVDRKRLSELSKRSRPSVLWAMTTTGGPHCARDHSGTGGKPSSRVGADLFSTQSCRGQPSRLLGRWRGSHERTPPDRTRRKWPRPLSSPGARRRDRAAPKPTTSRRSRPSEPGAGRCSVSGRPGDSLWPHGHVRDPVNRSSCYDLSQTRMAT